MIRAITSFGPKGYIEYGQRMIESFVKFWPQSVTLHVTLDSMIGEQEKISSPNVIYEVLSSKGLAEFKSRHWSNQEAHGLGKHNKNGAPNFSFDAVRFSHKVFAVTENYRQCPSGTLLWLDGDTRTHAPVTVELINTWCPTNKFAGFLDRPWLYTETGFHMWRLDNPVAAEFFKVWEEYYTSDRIFKLPAWTDCHTYDATRRQFDSALWHNLSPNFNHPHPFINGVLGEVMDHMKGPRKITGRSHPRDLVIKRDGYWNDNI